MAAMAPEQLHQINRDAMRDIEVQHTGRSTEGWNREGETPGMARLRAVAAGLFGNNLHAPAPAPIPVPAPATMPRARNERPSAALLAAAASMAPPVLGPPAPAPAPSDSGAPEVQDGSDTDDPDEN